MNWPDYVEQTIRQFSHYHRYEWMNIGFIAGVFLITGIGLTAYIMW